MNDPKNAAVVGELLKAKGERTEADAIASIVEKHLRVRCLDLETLDGTCEVLAVPKGIELRSVKPFVDEYRDAPERRAGTAHMTELGSFITHVKRFADADSAIFADRTPTAPVMLAVLDYNRAGAEAAPRFGVHRTRYAFPLSEEWLAWTQAAGKPMSQAAFAEFLENRIADCLDPMGDAAKLASTVKAMESLLCTFASPARLMDLARGLTVRIDSTVVNAQNLKSGESTLRFDTAHTDERGQPLDVPGAFLIGLPVFRGGEPYAIAARLRYRVRDGRVTWHFDLYRATQTFDYAFSDACSRAVAATGLPLFMGTPE